jgi:hypothetical protein
VQEAGDALLFGANPLRAEVNFITDEVLAEGAASNAVLRFEDEDALSGGLELAGRRQPGEASAHYDDIKGRIVLGHG